MAFALITPASRGIGFALTRHLLATTPASLPIVATTRRDVPGTRQRILSNLPASSSTPSGDPRSSVSLGSLASDRLHIVPCNLESESSIDGLASYIQEKLMGRPDAHLRLGFCVPGMLVPERAPEKIQYESALHTLKLNLLAPMLLAKHLTSFLPLRATKLTAIEGMNDSAVLAFMSARVGSIADNSRGGWYSYRSSKAGVNQLVKSLDLHLKIRSGDSAMSVALHPGTVKTELSKEFWASTPKEKLFEPEFAAERLVQVVRGLDVTKGRGRCWDWKGKEIMP